MKTIKTIMITLILIGTLSVILNDSYITKVSAIEDVTPPVLDNIWVTPSTINDGEKIKVITEVTDDISGIKRVECHIYSPSETQFIPISLTLNTTSNAWETEIIIPQHSENGLWTIKSVYCTDNVNNYKQYQYNIDYTADFTVTSTTQDNTPPTLESIQVTPSTINDGEKIKVITEVTDDISGIKRVECHIYSPNETQFIPISLTLNTTSNAWETEIIIPQHSENGLWTIKSVYCTDNVNNYKQYQYNIDYTADFTVTSTTQDNTPPTLESIQVTPSTINDGEKIKVITEVTDDISGIKRVECHIYSPSETQFIPISLTLNTTSNAWETEIIIPQHSENGLWTIKSVYCTDNVNNYKQYQYNIDYTADFTVTSTTQDNTPPTLESIQVTPSTINDGEKIKVITEVTDDISGIKRVECHIYSPSETQFIPISLTLNTTSNAWETEIIIPQHSENGLWTIKSVYCTDNVNNYKQYQYNIDYTADFTVTSLPQDIMPPTLNAVWVSSSLVESGGSVTVYVKATDELSNVETVTCYLQSPNGKQRITAVCTYNQACDAWVALVQIPKGSNTGRWTVAQVNCKDSAQNAKDYYYNVDYVAKFTVKAPTPVPKPSKIKPFWPRFSYHNYWKQLFNIYRFYYHR